MEPDSSDGFVELFFGKYLFVCLFIKLKTTFSFEHNALDVCESSPARCVEQVYTNHSSAYPPLFVHLAQKTGNQQIRLQITAVF